MCREAGLPPGLLSPADKDIIQVPGSAQNVLAPIPRTKPVVMEIVRVAKGVQLGWPIAPKTGSDMFAPRCVRLAACARATLRNNMVARPPPSSLVSGPLQGWL